MNGSEIFQIKVKSKLVMVIRVQRKYNDGNKGVFNAKDTYQDITIRNTSDCILYLDQELTRIKHCLAFTTLRRMIG
jgi:hypothetical protein